MKFKQLLDILNRHQSKQLRFEYEPGKFVNSNFHITEVKNLRVEAVDCGGRMDRWNETILQLWNPSSPEERYPMKGEKALSILDIVDRKSKIDPDSEVYFEYGNESMHVSNFAVEDIRIHDDDVTFQFAGLTTQCKPRSEKGEECCAPAVAEATLEIGHAPKGCC